MASSHTGNTHVGCPSATDPEGAQGYRHVRLTLKRKVVRSGSGSLTSGKDSTTYDAPHTVYVRYSPDAVPESHTARSQRSVGPVTGPRQRAR